jgi:outer membrane biosynthesis protein TonB
MENSANIMRIALIGSIIAHVLFVTFTSHDLWPTSHGEEMTVDLVPANEAPSGPPLDTKSDTSESAAKDAKAGQAPDKASPSQTSTPAGKPESKTNAAKAPDTKAPDTKTPEAKPPETKAQETKTPEAKPAETKTAQTKPAPTAAKAPEQKPPQPQQAPPSQQAQPQPQPEQTAAQPPPPDQQPAGVREMPPDMNRLAEMLGLPISDAGSSGTTDARMSKFTEGVKEFKAQVRKCLTLPPGIAPNQRIKMVIRVQLTRSGALAGDPAVMDAVNPSVGYPLMQSVMKALRQCAPYNLPADKYNDWRVLDIDFSPDQMTGS